MLAITDPAGNSLFVYAAVRISVEMAYQAFGMPVGGYGCSCRFLGTVLTRADSYTGMPPAWATPGVMAMKKAGPVNGAQHEPNFLSNLDCGLMDYRLSDGRTMGSGCFTPTAFGLMDVDSGVIVFNGTDEGLALLPYSAQQGVVPWTQALSVVTLESVSTGGSYIGMYKNPLASIRDQRDSFARLTAKQLTAPPDIWFKDPSGKLLVVNAQTTAFSDNGSWLVAETLNGSFVRINLATLDVTAFAPSFGTTGSPGLLRSQVAVSSNGRYVAIDNDAASVLRVYYLATCDGLIGSQLGVGQGNPGSLNDQGGMGTPASDLTQARDPGSSNMSPNRYYELRAS
jgi:hypothetical protein